MPPVQTPPWEEWRMRVPTVIPPSSTMFKNQGKLPRLPVPKLDDTLPRLVRSCEALSEDPAAVRAVQEKAEAFGRSATGQKLQSLLERKREQPGVRNWLAKDWDEQAYMAFRGSVVVNVSYYFGVRIFASLGPENNTA